VRQTQEIPSPTNGVAAGGKVNAIAVRRRMLRLWIVDDNAPLRGAFAHLLNGQPWLRVSQQFSSVQAALTCLGEERAPDIILVDLSVGKENALAAIRPISRLAPTARILLVATFNDTCSEAEAFRLGASGFLLKTYEIAEIVALIHQAYHQPDDTRLFPNLACYAQPRDSKSPRASLTSYKRKRSRLFVSLRRLWRLRRGEGLHV